MIKPPVIHEIDRLKLSGYSTQILSNGLQLHTVIAHDTDVCRLSLILPGGDEDAPHPSMISLANSLLAEGTKSSNAEEIADRLDFEGAWWAPSTATHHSLLNFYSLSDKMPAILNTALEMVMAPSFPAEAVSNREMQVAGQLEVRQRQVDFIAGVESKKLVFMPGSRTAETATPEMVRSFTADELREVHFRRLSPRDMHCCVSGHLTSKSLDHIANCLERIRQTAESYAFENLAFRDSYVSERIDIEVPDAVQSSVRISVPTIGRSNSDFIAVRFAVMALGGGFGSRLMSNVREEKGLTYGISASLSGYRDKGIMNISCQTRSPEEVIEECLLEIKRLADPASYTNEEIIRLRRYILSGLASTLDTPFSRMDFLQTQITAGTPCNYFARQESLARSLTPEILAAAAAKYLQGAELIVTAG